MDDSRVGRVSRALHTFHGQGYCSMGPHLAGLNFYCYDEARAVLAAVDGEEQADYPDHEKALTLSARQEQRLRATNRIRAGGRK